jgi:hypothetical protein
VDISNQAITDSGGDLSIPLFVAGFVVGLGLGLKNDRTRKSRLVIEDRILLQQLFILSCLEILGSIRIL